MTPGRLAWLGWIGAALGCTPATGVPRPTPSAESSGAQPTSPELVRYAPATTRYRIHRRIESVQAFSGAEQRTSLGFSIFVMAAVGGPADSTGFPTTFAIDSIALDSGVVLPMFIDLDAARGLRFTGVLTPAGEFRDGVPSDTGAASALTRIIGGFREFYPRIPPQGITLGGAWTGTVAHNDQFGVVDRVTVTTTDSARAAEWEDRDDVRSLRVEIRSIVSLTGSGQQAGQAVELTGSGTRRGVEYIAADGRYLGGVSRDSTALTITLHAQGLIVPVRQVALSIVQVLP